MGKTKKKTKDILNKSKKFDYNITGSAGEFIVAAELSRRGIIATLTLKNTPLIDVIATNPKKGLVANIQVKTRSQFNKQGWVLNKKVEEKINIKKLFYVFVNLKELSELPDYYIVPHNIFATYIAKNHKAWLAGTYKDGSPRKDNSIRNFKPDGNHKEFGEKYKNNWNILKIF